jgi:hypothetical protein
MNIKSAVVTVGIGRGFVVEGTRSIPAAGGYPSLHVRERYVVTAAHCLSNVPPCHSAMEDWERTYPDWLGPLGAPPSVPAVALFVDPISDIAVLGSPDNEYDEEGAEAYDAFISSCSVMAISDAPEKGRAFLLSLAGEPMQCLVQHFGGPLCISEAVPGIAGGMSGSPIIAADGTAIGVVTTGSYNDDDFEKPCAEGAPNPRLIYHLPGWLLRALIPSIFSNYDPLNDP